MHVRSVRRQVSQHSNKIAQPIFLLIVERFVTVTWSGIFHSMGLLHFSFPHVQFAQRIVRLRKRPSLSLPGPKTASLLVSKLLRSVVVFRPCPTRSPHRDTCSWPLGWRGTAFLETL